MPDTDLSEWTAEQRALADEYESGYDWIPGRFGPPPGIPRQRKEELDVMNYSEYMSEVMGMMCLEERESLMSSEEERLRTFGPDGVAWADADFADYAALAAEGFYYTGNADNVQCAFCSEKFWHWARGDIPREEHLHRSRECKMARRMPCPNMPISIRQGLLSEEMNPDMGERTDRAELPSNIRGELVTNRNEPKHPNYKLKDDRLATYQGQPFNCPMSPEELSEAGFFYEGPGDKVKCFWCEGALEQWETEDEPWADHARWYPGCSYVKRRKGRTFIKAARSVMSEDDLAAADRLQYNNSDEVDAALMSQATHFDSYEVCKKMGLCEESLQEAFERNDYHNFKSVQTLISAVRAIEDGQTSKLERVLEDEEAHRTDSIEDSIEPTVSNDHRKVLNVQKLIKTRDIPEDLAIDVEAALTCVVCEREEIGAVVLPCGDFILCQTCSKRNRLPFTCPTCHTPVRASCVCFLD